MLIGVQMGIFDLHTVFSSKELSISIDCEITICLHSQFYPILRSCIACIRLSDALIREASA